MAKPFLLLCLMIMIICSNEAPVGSNTEYERDAWNSSANFSSLDNIYEYVNNFNTSPDGYDTVEDLMNKIVLPAVVILAVFGNTVIIIILTRKRNRSFPTSMYLTSLAVAELILVFVSPFVEWLENVTGKVIIPIEIHCKLFLPLLYTPAMNSSWTLAIIAIERVVSVTVPHKVKVICSMDIAKRVLIGIWMASVAFTVFLAFAFKPYGKSDCMVINMYISFYVFDLSIIILVFLIPFAIILVATVIIIVQLYKRKKQSISSKRFDVWPITVTLIFTNIAFIATVMPINLIFMTYKIQGFLGVKQIDNIFFLMNTFRLLLYSNACLNFFIYFLSGTRFRTEVKELFTCGNKKPTSSVK